MTRNCGWCGELFESSFTLRVYCSRECAKKKINRRKYELTRGNEAYRAKRVRLYHRRVKSDPEKWLTKWRKKALKYGAKNREEKARRQRIYYRKSKLCEKVLSTLGVNGVEGATAIATVKQLGINIGDYNVT